MSTDSPRVRINMAPKYEVKGKGSFSISRDNLLSQLALQRAKPPSAERDTMLAHMESLLAEMDG